MPTNMNTAYPGYKPPESTRLAANPPVVPTWGEVNNFAAMELPPWIDDTPKKSEAELQKEKITEALKGWPWKKAPPKLLTLGPYFFNDLDNDYDSPRFALPEVIQSCPLFSILFTNTMVASEVMKYLFQYHDSSWKFAATCRQAWQWMVSLITPWDVRGGYFNDCEKVEGDKPQGSISTVVLVAPYRTNFEKPSYRKQLYWQNKLLLSVQNWGENIQYIDFHRTGFLTTSILDLILPNMRKLKKVGVYKCELIHLADASELLRIITTDRAKGLEHSVDLDFYPNFERAPSEELSNNDFMESYGVVWDNWNGDSCRAIWAIVMPVIKQAREQTIDFESKHTSFRKWLDDSPCWKVEETLAAYFSETPNVNETAALIDSRNYQHHGNVALFTGKVANRPEGWEWAVDHYCCSGCRENLLGIFYSFAGLRQFRQLDDSIVIPPGAFILCLGCQLTSVLNNEGDHFKFQKKEIVKAWLRLPKEDASPSNNEDNTGTTELKLNTNDLSLAIHHYNAKHVWKMGLQLDKIRKIVIDQRGYDIETEERQKPLSKAEKLKYGMKNRSPTIYEEGLYLKRQAQIAIDGEDWNYVGEDRMWAQGH